MTAKTKRPPWDTSAPGKHPAFAPPTHEEVKRLAGGLGRVMMTDDQRFVEQWLRQEELCRANLELFEAQRRKKEAHQYRGALANALCRLGRFAEAVDLVAKKGRARPGYAKLLSEIKLFQYAVEIDDDVFCGCDRPKATLEVTAKQSVEVELNRRYALGEVFSQKHRKVVTVWVCDVCGEPNAYDGTPERQQKIEEARRAVAASIKSVHDKMPAQYSDDQLLK